MSNTIPLITEKTSGLLTRKELRTYLKVGKNEIPLILERFELEPVEGLFPLRSIWRQIMGIEPVDAVQEMSLRQQLQKIDWVARQVGRGASTVRTKLKESRFAYAAPIVDLGDPEKNSRLKRWIPEQILAQKRGDDVPAFRAAAPVRGAAARHDVASCHQESRADDLGNNAFAEIIRSNAGSSP